MGQSNGGTTVEVGKILVFLTKTRYVPHFGT